MLSLRLLLVLAPFIFKGARCSPIADAPPVNDPPWGIGPDPGPPWGVGARPNPPYGIGPYPTWGCEFMKPCVKLWDDINCHPRHGKKPLITFTPICPPDPNFCYTFPWLDVRNSMNILQYHLTMGKQETRGGVGHKDVNWLSLTTKGGVFDSTNCRVYSDTDCKDLIIETHNHQTKKCFASSPGGRSIQCWEGCSGLNGRKMAKRNETLDSEATPDHEEILTADDEETLTLVGSHNPKSS